MTSAKYSLLLGIAMLCAVPWSHAQLTVSDTLTKTEMLQTLFGNGIFISNLNYQFCDTTNAMREFDATNTIMGLDRGVLLSTGMAAGATNPAGLQACNVTASTSLGMPGYAPLNALLAGGFTTNDACRISFDITALCDTIAIRYVFASEEYPQYVNSSFNDVFAFWISGPGYGPPPGTNISVIPGTATPVSINTINNGPSAVCTPPAGPCVNCGLYVNNQFNTTTSYNAWTKPLLAEASVIPCSTYTVTIAVADAGDFILDSGVFLEAGGIGCSSPALQLSASNSTVLGTNIAVEGCVNFGQIEFTLPTPLPDSTVFYFTVGGTATPGIDYLTLPDSIIMPAGQTSFILPIIIYEDTILEGSEFIEIYYVDSASCGTNIYRDTAILEILDKPEIPRVDDVSVCPGQTVTVPVSGAPLPGMTFQWQPALGLSTTTSPLTNVTLPNLTTTQYISQYILTTTALQGFCLYRDTIDVTVHPSLDVAFGADTVCLGLPTTFLDRTITDSVVSYTWTFGDGNLSTDTNPIHTYTDHGIFQVQLAAENTAGCRDSLTQAVLVDSLPLITFTADPACDDAPVLFQNTTRAQTSYVWTYGDGEGSTIPAPNHIYPTFGTFIASLIATTAAGCQDSASQEVTVYQNPESAFEFQEACDGQEVQFAQAALNGTGQNLQYQWQFGDATAGPNTTQPDPSHLYGTFGLKQVRLTVTDEFGCTDDSLRTLEVFPKPVANFMVEPQCRFDEFVLNNLSTVVANKDIVRQWWDFGTENRTSVALSPTLNYVEEGTYEIFLKVETENGCLDSITQSIDIYPLPEASFVHQNACISDEAVVFNRSTILNPLFNDRVEDWTWTWGDGTQTQGGDTAMHRYATPGVYDVTLLVLSDKGCENSITREVDIYALPLDPALVSDTVCFSDQGFLMAMAPSSVQVNWYYQESDLTPFQTSYSYVTPPQVFTTTYFVEPVSEFGCVGSRLPITVNIFDNEDGQIEASATMVEIPAAVVNFAVSGSLRPVSFQWNFGDGNRSEVAQPAHEYQYPGIYQVEAKVIDANGCDYLLQEVIEVKELITIYVPSAFTPNGDGFNDELFIGSNQIRELEFQVFNRWGQMIYQTRDPNFRWNGNGPSGNEISEGIYVFRVRAVDFQGRPIEKSGTLTILR